MGPTGRSLRRSLYRPRNSRPASRFGRGMSRRTAVDRARHIGSVQRLRGVHVSSPWDVLTTVAHGSGSIRRFRHEGRFTRPPFKLLSKKIGALAQIAESMLSESTGARSAPSERVSFSSVQRRAACRHSAIVFHIRPPATALDVYDAVLERVKSSSLRKTPLC